MFLHVAHDEDYLEINWSLVDINNLTNKTNANQTQITILGNATQYTYASILQTAKFGNTADEPTPPYIPVNRDILFEVKDSNFFATATATVTLEPVNDPPTIQVGNVTFNETTREPIFLFASSTLIDDTDHKQLIWITIEIYPHIDSLDNLTIPDITGVNISREYIWAPTSVCFPATNEFTVQRINISGPANKSVFQDALYNITYNNDCPGLVLTQRSVRIDLFDGDDIDIVWTFIDIEAFNDTPVCFFGPWPVSNFVLMYLYS